VDSLTIRGSASLYNGDVRIRVSETRGWNADMTSQLNGALKAINHNM